MSTRYTFRYTWVHSTAGVRSGLLLLAGVLLMGVTGCEDKNVRAAAPVAAAPSATDTAHPMTVAPDTTAAAPPLETAVPPPAPPATASTAPAVTITPTKPPAPKRPTEQPPATEADVATHPAAPQISPQLSPGDQANYQRKTTEDISTAEANLQRAGGRQLNAAQQDLVEKIRSFLGQSRDAGKSGDWVRAQNLSQKARLLSAELIGSL
jgi:hypothetical protein